MKTLLFPLLLLSITLTAQEKEKPEALPKKTDTLKKDNKEQISGVVESKTTRQQKDFYKILIKKPKDSPVYMALKEHDKDYSKYKILNSITPEKPKTNLDKIPKPTK